MYQTELLIKSRGEVSKIIASISKVFILFTRSLKKLTLTITDFEFKAIILDSSPLDLIIGRSTIKKYGLVHQTQELMTLVCVMFGLLSAPLMGMLKVDLLGCF